MKKILFAVSVVSMFCWANEIVVDCDEGYEEKFVMAIIAALRQSVYIKIQICLGLTSTI
ncbi:hypothetical protein VB002_06665 [Campylobacter concisus]